MNATVDVLTDSQDAKGVTAQSAIWQALRDVYDPEIPTISVVDLGIVRRVTVDDEEALIELLPTFVACPAVEVIRAEVAARVAALVVAPRVRVVLSFAEPWTSARISAAGRAALRAAGFAPPADAPAFVAADAADLNPLGRLRPALPPCPNCGSRNTLQENRFGPTLCRSIYYCNGCRQPFEGLKAV